MCLQQRHSNRCQSLLEHRGKIMTTWVSSDAIRAQFSQCMSEMYQTEVPLYGDLLELVNHVNQISLVKRPQVQLL